MLADPTPLSEGETTFEATISPMAFATLTTGILSLGFRGRELSPCHVVQLPTVRPESRPHRSITWPPFFVRSQDYVSRPRNSGPSAPATLANQPYHLFF